MTERRIVEYKMLRVSGNAMTTEAVNKEIADGFQPYGSKIHIETGSNFFHFYLPMVRYAEPEPDNKLAQLAFALAKRVKGLNPPSKYSQFHDPADAILAIEAGGDNGWKPEPDNAALQTEIERLRAVVAKFEAELGDWHDCARIDAKMSGPVLMGWDRRQLDRCWEKHIRNRPADQTGGEG
jgi:hypothetical protein